MSVLRSVTGHPFPARSTAPASVRARSGLRMVQTCHGQGKQSPWVEGGLKSLVAMGVSARGLMLDVCGCVEFAGCQMKEETMKKDSSHRFGCEPCLLQIQASELAHMRQISRPQSKKPGPR